MLIVAYHSANNTSVTGGDRYDQFLMQEWGKALPVRFAPVRYRWFLLRCYAWALLASQWRYMGKAKFLFQNATSAHSSPLLIRLCRVLFPRIKHIGSVHHPRWLETPSLLEWEKRFFNSYDYLIVNSEYTRSQLREAGVDRPVCHVLRPGRAKMSARTVERVEPPMILWNGYMLPRKGGFTLLEALGRLRSERWQARFIVSQWGGHEPSFRAKLGSLPESVSGRVKVFNRLPIDRFREEFFSASIFCLPSLVEGYSISTAEAMACGCAVVVPRTGVFEELLGDKQYVGLYDPENPDALPAVLDRLLQDEALRSAAAAHCLKRSADLPDWDRFADGARDLLPLFSMEGAQAASTSR